MQRQVVCMQRQVVRLGRLSHGPPRALRARFAQRRSRRRLPLTDEQRRARAERRHDRIFTLVLLIIILLGGGLVMIVLGDALSGKSIGVGA